MRFRRRGDGFFRGRGVFARNRFFRRFRRLIFRRTEFYFGLWRAIDFLQYVSVQWKLLAGLWLFGWRADVVFVLGVKFEIAAGERFGTEDISLEHPEKCALSRTSLERPSWLRGEARTAVMTKLSRVVRMRLHEWSCVVALKDALGRPASPGTVL